MNSGVKAQRSTEPKRKSNGLFACFMCTRQTKATHKPRKELPLKQDKQKSPTPDGKCASLPN